ncbi:outer membrane beta-barrel protein [Persicitalea sp.]|uniref:outer membrane beta-barrel protein n=1 Tax=Persicitalea sp. TaxID=3100273 RepID=UPI003593D6B4
MKTNQIIFSLFLFLIAGLPALSQTPIISTSVPLEKGSHFVGLNATGNYSGGDNNSSGLQLTAQGGIFVAKGLVTGVQLSYDKFYGERTLSSVVGSPANVDAERTVKNFSPELFARYYLFQSKVRPILQVSAGGIFQSTDRKDFDGLESKKSRKGFTAAAGLGVGFFVAKRVSVELMYQRRTQPAIIMRGNDELWLGISIFLR